jgi:GPH family glycoside/pentoside/hexuronide:cation symporter
VPYVVAVLVGEGDDVTSYVLIALVGVSALCFAFVEPLTIRFGKRRLFMGSMAVFALMLPVTTLIGLIPRWMDFGESMLNLRLAVLVGACALIAPALAVALVVPRAILSEVMDYDTQRTGYRREAMYNGMEGLIQKVAMALIPFAVGELFAAFGYSEDRPWGIVLSGIAGGLMALGGIVCFWFYPLRDKNDR